MGRLNYTKQEVRRAITEKLKARLRYAKEGQAWYEVDGRAVLRITIPKGRSDLPPGTLNSIINQLKLSKPEFSRLVKCPMRGKHYEQVIRGKIQQGLL